MKTLRLFVALVFAVSAVTLVASAQEAAKPKPGCCAAMDHAGHAGAPAEKAEGCCAKAGETGAKGMACCMAGCQGGECCKDGNCCPHEDGKSGCCDLKTAPDGDKPADTAGCCPKSGKSPK